MKIFRAFLPFLLLALFSLCPFLPKQSQQDSTHLSDSKTPAPLQQSSTPTIIVETPTATVTEVPPLPTPSVTQEILPSPTRKPLIPENLQGITVENIRTLKLIAEIPYSQIQPNHHIYALTVSNEGTKLAIESQNLDNRQNTLVVWDLISNLPILEFEDSSFVGQVYFSPDDNQLWAFREGFIDQYALQNGLLINSIEMPEFSESAVAISPDGKTLVTGIFDSVVTQNSTVYFYKFGSLDPYFSEVIAYGISSFRFSPNSKMVVGRSGEIGSDLRKIWDVEYGTLVKVLHNYYGPTFSSDSTLAVFEKENQIYILSTNTWNIKKIFQNEDANAATKFFLGGDQILAIKGYSNITFIDVDTGDDLFKLIDQANIISFSPNLGIIITNLWGGNIKLWGIVP